MVTQYLVGLRLLVVRFVSFIVGLPPIVVTIGRQRFWVDPKSGRLFPAVAGASPDEGGDDADADADKGGDKDDDADKDKSGAGGGDDKDDADDDDDDADAKREPNWKRLSRKHERERKRAEQERDEAKRLLQEQEDAKKTDQQKAVDEAAKTAREEAKQEYEQERQHDRLENAAIRAGAKGITITVGKGKDAEEKTVKLADPDDAMLYLERDIKNGELDHEDLFDDKGRVDRTKLEEALADLYDRKKHLFADDNAGGDAKKKVEGGADGGKGGGDLKTEEEGSVDDHFKVVRRSKPANG